MLKVNGLLQFRVLFDECSIVQLLDLKLLILLLHRQGLDPLVLLPNLLLQLNDGPSILR